MLDKNKIFHIKRHRIHAVGFLCLLVMYVSASALVHVQQPPPLPPDKPKNQAGKRKVELKQAGSLIKREGVDYQILLDSVVLYHDGAIMYCDSAHMNEATNTFDAFGRIEVIQGDTLFLYGRFMHYNGNNKLLEIRKDVRLENNKDMTLFTDSLNYDRMANLAYYFEGGMLVDSENQLTSYWGQYQPGLKLATFRDSVVLINEKFTMHSDLLKYYTDTKIAKIESPTTIISDSGTIYSSSGWYNTVTDESLLLNQSLLVNKEGNRTMRGDSISYNRQKGYGEIFGNMYLQDTLKKIILRGHYGYYDEKTDYALATDSAFSIEYSQGDSLYIHADTLILRTIKIDSLNTPKREIEAFHNVRFYRSDIQGVCDSMLFKSQDSTLYLYKDPILWNENYQLSGDTIEVYLNDSTIEMAYIKRYSFAIEDMDSVHFNQLKGRNMKVYFENKEMRHVLVEGNAESIFYPLENDGSIIGHNQTESSFLSINLNNRKIERLKIWPESKGLLTPLPDIQQDKLTLRDFQWYYYLRPLNKDDIFRHVRKRESTATIPKRSDRFKQN